MPSYLGDSSSLSTGTLGVHVFLIIRYVLYDNQIIPRWTSEGLLSRVTALSCLLVFLSLHLVCVCVSASDSLCFLDQIETSHLYFSICFANLTSTFITRCESSIASIVVERWPAFGPCAISYHQAYSVGTVQG